MTVEKKSDFEFSVEISILGSSEPKMVVFTKYPSVSVCGWMKICFAKDQTNVPILIKFGMSE